MFYMKNNNIVGKRISIARKIHNPPMTQEDLVRELQLKGFNMERGAIAKIETGIRKVSDYEILNIAKVLDLEVGWFFDE